MSKEIKLEFTHLDNLTANKYAIELNQYILREDQYIKTSILSEEGDMDAGSILTIVLGAPSIIIVAKGIADFLRRRNDAKITIKNKDNIVIASGLDSKSAIKIAEILQNQSDKK